VSRAPGKLGAFPTRLGANRVMQKQLSLKVSAKDYIAIRREAATRGVSMVEMLGEWIEPELKLIRGRE